MTFLKRIPTNGSVMIAWKRARVLIGMKSTRLPLLSPYFRTSSTGHRRSALTNAVIGTNAQPKQFNQRIQTETLPKLFMSAILHPIRRTSFRESQTARRGAFRRFANLLLSQGVQAYKKDQGSCRTLSSLAFVISD